MQPLHVLSGVQMDIGGEGMKTFYNKILVNAANKIGKKFGAKVGTTNVSTYKEHKAGYEGSTAGQEVWTLPITPEMRAEVKAKGFPLFAGGAPVGGLLSEPDQRKGLLAR